MNIINRIDENQYYILYKRNLDKNDVSSKYSIYRTDEYGGDLFKDFRYLSEARKIFKKLTNECIEHEKITV